MYPYKITPGGIWGMTTVLHEMFPAIPQGWFGYMMDIPLLLIGFAVFGPVFGARTVFASLITPLLMLVLPLVVDPSVMDLSNDLILASVFGGIMIGAGVGLVVRTGATTGGTDIIGMLFQRFAGLRFSTGVMIADGFVVLCGIAVLVVAHGESPTLPLYSLLTIWIVAKVIDLAVDGFQHEKVLFIVSDRKKEIRDFIIGDLDRSGTIIRSSGMYTGGEKDIIFLVVSRREIVRVKRQLRQIDPGMFVVVMDAHETLGEGFRSFAEMKEL